MSDTTAVDFQKSIQERLNSKLKESLIDLIPPEVLQEKSNEAALYFLNGKTNFRYTEERERYDIMKDPDTLIGMLFADMQRQAAQAIRAEFDSNPLFKQAYDAASKEAVRKAMTELVTENAGAVLVGVVGDVMAMHMQQFAMNFEQNLRNKGFHI
jgi:hypothetical protein